MATFAAQLARVRRLHPGVGLAHQYERPFVDRWLAGRNGAHTNGGDTNGGHANGRPVVLDAGCGFRYGLLMHYEGRWRVVGVDIDQATIAKNRDVDIRITGDCQCIPLAAESVDLVVSRDVLEHLPRPAEAIAEFARVLKPGGALVLTTVSVENPGMWSARFVGPRLRRYIRSLNWGPELAENFRTFYRANRPPALRRLLVAAGFDVRYERHWPTFLWYFGFFTPALLALAAVNRALDALGLSRFFAGLTVGAVKVAR